MKKLILATTLVSVSLFTAPAGAVDSHHPAEKDTQTIEQMTMDQAGLTAADLEKMREKVEGETDPAKRQKMMHQHMEMMHECMNMMSRMSGKHKGMSHGSNEQMSMEGRMEMMEEKMEMMQEMMNGMLMQQGMRDQSNTPHLK